MRVLRASGLSWFAMMLLIGSSDCCSLPRLKTLRVGVTLHPYYSFVANIVTTEPNSCR